MKKEIWKPIPSLKNLYEASTIGRIRRAVPFHKSKGKKILSPQISNTNYLRVYISLEGKSFYQSVHRLVCEAFYGPSNGREVDHLNNNPSDNRPENLEWVTRSENNRRARQRGYKQEWTKEMRAKVSQAHKKRYKENPQSFALGDRCNFAKISEEAAKSIIELLRDPDRSRASIARELGVNPNTVYGIASNNTWKHLPR